MEKESNYTTRKKEENVCRYLTLKSQHGINFIRHDLGITDYVTISKEVSAALAKSVSNIAKTSAESMPLEDLPKAATDIKRNLKEVVSIIRQDGETQTEGLPLRELLALDKALQTTRGELVNNLAKLSELDEEIKDLQELYTSARDRDDEDVEVSEELREQLRKNERTGQRE